MPPGEDLKRILGKIQEGVARGREDKIISLSLTYICLFVVLDEFSKLKVPSDYGNLEKGTQGTGNE